MVHFNALGYSLNEGPQVPYAEMAFSLWAHRWTAPYVLNLEAEALRLHTDFALRQTDVWVDDVMRWGLQNRAVSKLIRVNGSELISETLATSDASATVATAFDNLAGLKAIGTSRISLLLRFLEPHVAMLSLPIANIYDYPHNKIGFLDYTQDCRAIADYLNNVTELPCPIFQHRPSNKWLAADVDMVNHAFTRRWCNKTPPDLIWRGVKKRDYIRLPRTHDAVISPDESIIIVRPSGRAGTDDICRRIPKDVDKGDISKPEKIIFLAEEEPRLPYWFKDWSTEHGVQTVTLLFKDKSPDKELLDIIEPPPDEYAIRPTRPLE